MMNQSAEVLFKLIRVALGNEDDPSLPNVVNWQEVFDLAVKQGVVNIAYDGLQLLMNANHEKDFGFDTPEMENLRYKWIGYGLSAERSYQQYVKVIEELGQLYRAHGFRMVLFKGYALSRYYPNPSHRLVGDIDIAILDESWGWCQRQADELFQREIGIRVLKARNTHHSKFVFRGLIVENHYEFSSTYMSGKKSMEFEEILKAACCGEKMEDMDGKLFLASPTFNALFLMWHLSSHFCGSYVTLRQLCDYLVFMKQEYDNVDWKYVRRVFQTYGLEKYAHIIDAILCNYFNAKKRIYTEGLRFPNLEIRVINDIFNSKEYKSMIDRIIRYPRFAWKYKLVQDSFWIRSVVKSIFIHLFHKEDLLDKSI